MTGTNSIAITTDNCDTAMLSYTHDVRTSPCPFVEFEPPLLGAKTSGAVEESGENAKVVSSMSGHC